MGHPAHGTAPGPGYTTRMTALRRLLWLSGGFNVTLAAPLALPWTLPAPGGPALLANTAGIDLVLIGLFVLYAARDPSRRRFIVAANAVGRLAFAAVVGYQVLTADVARIVLLIGGIDVVIALGFARLLTRLPERNAEDSPQSVR